MDKELTLLSRQYARRLRFSIFDVAMMDGSNTVFEHAFAFRLTVPEAVDAAYQMPRYEMYFWRLEVIL